MVDKSDMISTLRELPDNVKTAASLGTDITIEKEIKNIVVVGMGGSGFTGDLLRTYLEDEPIPVYVVKDYTLPPYVNKSSLIIAISYSGNTEETISSYRSAVRRGCPIVSISSGGKLRELAQMNGHDHILVPKGIQPRLAFPLLIIPALNVLANNNVIADQKVVLKKTYRNLKASAKRIEDSGKRLSEKLIYNIPLIYSSQRMFAIAEKWKTDINENAKTHAFFNVFPEFNHNEICGFTVPNGDFYIVIISDTDDHQKIKDRVEVFKKVIRDYDVEVTEIAITGENVLTRLLSTIWMGQFMSYYLALAYKQDPTPVDIIENFKKQLR